MTRRSSQHGGNAPPRRTCPLCGFTGTRGIGSLGTCRSRTACAKRLRAVEKTGCLR